MTDGDGKSAEANKELDQRDLIALEHQSLLEIVMAVGNGTDLRTMLQSSLSVMMRKLGCNFGAVVRSVDSEMTVVHAIPYHMKSSTEVLSICQLALPASSNPLLVETAGRILMAFKLPGYGVLVLGRSGEPLARRVLGKVSQIAEKLATACISCEQSHAIRQSQFATEQALATLDATLDAALVIDPESLGFTYVNQGAVHQLGYTRAELLGMSLMDINPDLDEPQLRALFSTLLDGERALMNFTARHRRKDGTDLPVEINLHMVELETGKPRLIASARDITERKRAEDEIHALNANLEARVKERTAELGMANATVTAFKAALDEHSIVTITDGLGKLNYVNDRFCALSKYSREELIGQDHRIVNSGHHSNVFFRDLWQRIAAGQVWHGEIKNRAKDGSAFWVDTTIVPFIGADGDQSQYIAIRADITDRKRAEEAIEGFTSGLEVLVAQRTSEMRQALATLDATADGAFIFDPETLSFTYVNQGATRQLGYTCDELLVLTPLGITPEFDEPRFRELLKPLLDGAKSVVSYTTRHRCKDGRLFPVEISLQLVTIDAGKPRFIAIARDITERLDHESKERRAQRIESIGTLAGGVAHDLNNALAPILMTCELMRMDFPASPEMSEMIETIESSARRGADMVRQLLTFAKGVEGERRLIQPRQLFDQMQKIVRSTFPKQVQLRTSLAPGLMTVLGDYTQLHQVLLNLCVNARDAMTNGGTLTLEAENVEIDAASAATIPGCRGGTHVVWRIIDTGSGIPPELLERIFEPFFSTKGQDGGTGLGLSTVSGIVRSHGGFIRVASTLGQGTTFSVHLPAETRPPAGTEIAAKIEPAFRGNNEMILVVDDEPAVRKVTSSVLMGLNFQVLTAADGTEALMKVAERRSELVAVVTDLHMPHMDGLTFVRALKRMLPATGIIVTSGRLEKQDILSFKALGVTAMLDKPFTQAQLVAAVRAIVQK